MSRVFFLIISMFFCLFINAEESRGLVKTIKELDPDATLGKQYAVFIAINNYKYWQPLKNPVKDAKELKSILQEKYYIDEFIELYDDDATKNGILKLFYGLNEKIEENDSLFIFYAGHGHLDTKLTKKGSWIPVDGGKDELFQDNWIPNDTLRAIIDNIKSKHILLISDSCFSGDILDSKRGAENPATNDYFKKAYQKVSRQILTSGASETVSDNSDFARALKTFLQYNNKPMIDPLTVFENVRIESSRNSTPMFGFIPNSHHQEGGSFLFFLKEDNVIIERFNNQLDSLVLNNNDIDQTLKNIVVLNTIQNEAETDNLKDIIARCEDIRKSLNDNVTNIIDDYNVKKSDIIEICDNYLEFEIISSKIKEKNISSFEDRIKKTRDVIVNNYISILSMINESDSDFNKIVDNYITLKDVQSKIENTQFRDISNRKLANIKKNINDKITSIGGKESILDLSINDYIIYSELRKTLIEKGVIEFSSNLEEKNAELSQSIESGFRKIGERNKSIDDMITGLNALLLYESRMNDNKVNQFENIILSLKKDMITGFSNAALDKTKKLQSEYLESVNKFDKYANEIKNINDIGKKYNLNSIVTNTEKVLNDIFYDKDNFEKVKISRVKNLIKNNLPDSESIISIKKELDLIKKEVNSTESLFVNLEREVDNIEEYIKLNTNLFKIKENERINSKKRVPYFAISGSLFGISFISTAAGIGLFGARNYLGDSLNRYYDKYKSSVNESDMSGINANYKKVEEYAGYTDSTMISGIVTLSIGAAALIPGIIMIVLSPKDSSKDIKKIEDQIKRLSITYNDVDDNISVSYNIKL